MAEYSYKKNRQTPKLEAQVVGEELERILKKNGELKAEGVVEESRPKHAVLHKELDLHLPVKDRAEMWSRNKARNIINVIEVVPVVPEGSSASTDPVPAYVNVVVGPVHNPESRSYRPMDEVLADPAMRANMVQRALEKLMRVQREFRHLKELESVWSAIDAVVVESD